MRVGHHVAGMVGGLREEGLHEFLLQVHVGVLRLEEEVEAEGELGVEVGNVQDTNKACVEHEG